MTQTETLELLVATLQQTNFTQSESIQRLTRQNEQLQNKLGELLAQVAWLNRQLFGRKSEKLSHLDPNQLSLFDMPVQALEQENAEEPRAEDIEPSTTGKKKERHNRKLLEGLPVVEITIEPEHLDLTKYKKIGEERTRTLEFEPGKLYVKEIIRPKYGLKDNTALPEEGQSSVIIASLPLSPIYKGLPGASLLTEILLQKYEYHVPFYRQIREFHHLGLKIPESTLHGWFKPACELFKPLYDELKKQVLLANYIQVDETTLPVINPQSHKASKEYLWMVRAVMDGLAFFYYDDGSRSGETVRNLLQSFKGYLQSDGYAAYNIFEGSKEVCLVGCLAHIRRRYEVAKEENGSLSKYALGQIQKLYRIEQIADQDGISDQARMLRRQEQAIPILDELEKWMETTYPKVLPKSRMGQAIAYAYQLWPRMKNYLKDGKLKIDNNLAENAIRPIALSRKNFLFCGNHEAAENTAVICSLLASCKASNINPREWMIDVIAQLPYYINDKEKDLRELLPNRWIKKNSTEL